MAKDLNYCSFIGRIGKELETKFTASGSAVLNFSIACSDDYKDKAGKELKQTNWINVVAFGKLAEIIGQYCAKGSKIFVSGKLTVRKWQDQSGTDRYTTEVVAGEMQMLDTRQQSSQGQSANQSQSAPIDDFDSQIPF